MTRRLLPFRRVEGTPAEMSDGALLAACAVGDSAALGALFDRHHDAVRGFLTRLAGGDVEDLVQITFETVPRAARRYDGRAAVRTWLLGVAGNVARHHVRSEIRRRRLLEAVAAAPGAPARDLAIEHEEHERLRAAILRLPPPLREVFVLVYVESVPGRDAAALLRVREGTVWKRLHQARELLRALLGEGRP